MPYRSRPYVLVVEDHPLVAESIVALVWEHTTAMQVCVAESLAASLRLIAQRTAPALILTDLALTDAIGTDVILRLREAAPQSPLLVITATDDSALRISAREAGAIGYVLKSTAISGLRHQIGVALGAFLPARCVQQSDDLGRLLTRAQIAVLAELASGRSNKEVGAMLNIGEETVGSHVKEILARLAVRNRTEAVVQYLKLVNGYRRPPGFVEGHD